MEGQRGKPRDERDLQSSEARGELRHGGAKTKTEAKTLLQHLTTYGL